MVNLGDWSPDPTRATRDDSLITIAADRLGITLTDSDTKLLASLEGQERFASFEQLVKAGTISDRAAGMFAVNSWRGKPDQVSVDYAVWRYAFRAAGFTINESTAPAPTRSKLLFRGAREDTVDGLAWSPRIETAAYFRDYRQHPGTTAYVWAALVPAEQQLAAYVDDIESEVIVDDPATLHPIQLSDDEVETLKTWQGGRFSGRGHPVRWAIARRQLRTLCRRNQTPPPRSTLPTPTTDPHRD